MVVAEKPLQSCSIPLCYKMVPQSVKSPPVKRKEVFYPRRKFKKEDTRVITVCCLACKDMVSAEALFYKGQCIEILPTRHISAEYRGHYYHICGGEIKVLLPKKQSISTKD
jgi:hypothetical protein